MFPVSLEPGIIRTPEIRTDQDLEYEIVIDFQGISIQDKEMNCLLGLDTVTINQPYQCQGTRKLIDISWKLFEGEKMVSEGDSGEYSGALWSDTVERTVGMFKGHTGHRYTLVLEVKQDASRLNTANPKIKVQIPRGLWEDYGAGIFIEKTEAKILAIIGMLVLISAFLARRFKGKVGASRPG